MSSKLINFEVQPGGVLQGSLRVPGDKSISHRSVMLGSLAEGVTEVDGLLEGDDVLATIGAFRAMGVQMQGPDNGRLVIHGVGMHGLKAPTAALDMGNSGTAMRLMSGVLAGQNFDSELIGDVSLSKRPMARVTEPLALMGARIVTNEGGRPPLRIHGGSKLKGIRYQLPMASAQVKSCLLLAGMYAEGETSVTEPAPTRDHTERMLNGFGYPVKTTGSSMSLQAGGSLRGCKIDVPADISSATFFLVGAAMTPGSDLLLQHVGINPTRIGVLNILKLMGADLELRNERTVGGEPVADIRVRGGRLTGITVPEDQVPLAIDEFPMLFVAAACARGETRITGADELRVKECDRIAVMVEGLKVLGVDVEELVDGAVIRGGEIHGGEVHSHDDHRIAMAFSMAALHADSPIIIHDCANVATSFPTYAELAREAGLQILVREATAG
ncbi:MAG: 3-phosphoshikimate 1-carboxyvinyltransferase [Gammaproteobacteria bacterium]|nr:3-phosphoshikimate 1-carboxyvinyltransferase [Gammaproteobacteria bacterium]